MHIHLIAICGTGMGSLAGLLLDEGHTVTGSDANVYPPMSTLLAELGVKVFEGYGAKNLDTPPELVIIGNAVSRDNTEVQAVLSQKIPYLSLPEALGRFFITGKKSIVVSGTHGKTTTSALISHLLHSLGSQSGFLFGGVMNNSPQPAQITLPLTPSPQGRGKLKKNYAIGTGEYFVIEGDEYDSAFFDKGPKFLHYQPYYTIITSLEFDHADIYRDLNHLTESFEKLIQIINPKGMLLACSHYPRLVEIVKQAKVPVETYGVESTVDGRQSTITWLATNLRYTQTSTIFEIQHHDKPIATLTSPMAGEHNVLNVLVAYALLHKLGYTAAQFQSALSTFAGVKRRQEVRGIVDDVIVIDDFAHHPTAVAQTIAAIKKKYADRPLWAVFEPRSNTSKRAVFQEAYAASFKEADHVILADIFMPEKVKEGKILDVKKIAADINSSARPNVPTSAPLAINISGVDAIVDHLVKNVRPHAVILVMSNGGFGGIHEKIIEQLKAK